MIRGAGGGTMIAQLGVGENMRVREPGWSRRWVAAALALTGAACSGAPLGGNQGSGGDGSGPCPDSTSCLPGGAGGALGAGGATGAGGKTSVPDGGQSCDQALANFMAALTAANACTPGRRISARSWWPLPQRVPEPHVRQPGVRQRRRHRGDGARELAPRGRRSYVILSAQLVYRECHAQRLLRERREQHHRDLYPDDQQRRRHRRRPRRG